ncbi:Bidirectional sugar transporter [Vigna angularis]|uniref:Bidirectional sugar transporter n=1 Tax=Phaseolus angularis TaxID=3914 RepID=A0A8T0KB57_PHAAN|nr:Bidirectional sugar transporter [Vigna angularis]
MSLLGAYSICEVGKEAAGVAGNVFAFGLFLSPIPTFRRIIRNGSTEMFSGLPYVYSLLNCLICLWYGTPLISPDNLLVTTVNTIGGVFQLVYITLFLIYAEKARKVRMLGLLLAVLGIFVIILVGSLQIDDSAMRRMFVGLLKIGHSDKKCRVYAFLSFTFHLPDEHLLLSLRIGAKWDRNCFRNCAIDIIFLLQEFIH